MRVASRRVSNHGQFGPKLLELRLRAGLTQAELATKLQVPKSTYVAWERSEAEPPMRALLPLALAFDGLKTVAYLIDFPEEAHARSSVDWEAFGQVFGEVKELAKRDKYEFDDQQLIGIVALAFQQEKKTVREAVDLVGQIIRLTRQKR